MKTTEGKKSASPHKIIIIYLVMLLTVLNICWRMYQRVLYALLASCANRSERKSVSPKRKWTFKRGKPYLNRSLHSKVLYILIPHWNTLISWWDTTCHSVEHKPPPRPNSPLMKPQLHLLDPDLDLDLHHIAHTHRYTSPKQGKWKKE